MVNTEVISKRYARALFEVSTSHQSLLNEIRLVTDIIQKQEGATEFFGSCLIDAQTKLNTLEQAFNNKGLSTEAFNFIKLLVDSDRLGLLAEISKMFEDLVDHEHGVTRGEVRSAAVLDAEARKRIEDIVAKITNKKVILSFAEDSKLVGGVVAQVGGWTFEDSVSSHMKRLREDLNRRSN